MRTFLIVALALAAGSAQAWDCEYERDIDATLDLSGSERLSVDAAAGDLKISGRPGLDQARARGRVCVSEEQWLEEARLLTEEGREARIAVDLPEYDGWNFLGNHYAYIDLEIEVPEGIALSVDDSSGDIELDGVGPVAVRDSSGDIEIVGARGDLTLEDSSGDIDLRGIEGNVTVVSDSSGDIYGRDIQGAVRVERDSSGEIRFTDVRDDFVVERDSSGDIVADTIGGDFRVLRDGSGDVSLRDVAGEVEIPEGS
jgi:hypothetical protein